MLNISNRKPKSIDINPFSIAAQLKEGSKMLIVNLLLKKVKTIPASLKEGSLTKFMFCHWCKEAGKNNNFTKGCEYFKKQYLDRHININDHWLVCAARIQSQITLHFSFAIQAGLIKLSLYKLFEIQHGEDQNQFECELYKSNGWSLILDESNTVSAEKTLAIVSKHLIASAKPIYQFLGLILLTDSTANTIIAEINWFFQAKHISYDDLMHICTDGASTMIGSQVGVATQLKNKNPFILEHHCISHKLALAAKDAAKQVEEFKQYEKIVHNIYSYFSRSPEHMMHLKITEENFGDPHLTVLNIIETRWLLLSNVIQNLNQILSSIIDALLEDSYNYTIAEALYNSIDETFIITTKFFADILETLR
ncbi:6518_t:CDS:2 [Cetraspora pellucida]|uniref:6518_t:CDS:1 n=1 Tax=Cetraspora pellucida TaxID=1433469 RepID=A0A9N9D0U1_9GLOM|nr:6518_t:CDS:2 [Cetraspora pellucida]